MVICKFIMNAKLWFNLVLFCYIMHSLPELPVFQKNNCKHRKAFTKQFLISEKLYFTIPTRRAIHKIVILIKTTLRRVD